MIYLNKMNPDLYKDDSFFALTFVSAVMGF
jgi:hypothetical protein